MKRLIRITGWLIAALAVLLLVVYFRYGGGKPYAFQPGAPLLGSDALETMIAYPEPIGNVAATNDTAQQQRVFFTIHPESKPEKIKLLEIKNGIGIPYPSEDFQAQLVTPLGVFCDRQNRLWVIDHGNHGIDPVKLFTFDLQRNELIKEYTFPVDVAEKGSFFNDLSVSPDGRWIAIADVSFWRKKPSLIIYDTQTGQSKSLLDGHPSIENQGWLPVNNIKKMRFFGGIADLMPGIDGLDFDPAGQWIYYAAMSHRQVFRLPVAVATDFNKSSKEVVEAVETVGEKPLSDGIRVDNLQNVLITDVDHNGIHVINGNSHVAFTLLKDDRIRWADGLSKGGDGYWYLADSAIPHQMLQNKKHIQTNAPYYIYRFKY